MNDDLPIHAQRARANGGPEVLMIELNSEQARGVAAEDELAVGVGDPHGLQALQHLGDAADLVRVVAAGEDLAGAGEADGQLKRARIEVDGIEEELFEI